MSNAGLIRGMLKPVLLVTVLLSAGEAVVGQAQDSGNGEVFWLLQAPGPMVASVHDFAKMQSSQDGWQAEVSDARDAFMVMEPVEIDADRHKFLYLDAAFESGTLLQIFFGGEGSHFSEQTSCRVRRLENASRPTVLAIDMSHLQAWRGKIKALRIDVDGVEKDSKVILRRIGVTERLLKTASAYQRVAEPNTGGHAGFRRCAAWQDTIVAIQERHAGAGILTFNKDAFTYVGLHVLAKLLIQVDDNGQLLSTDRANNLVVEDMPGGARARFELAGAMVTAELRPLMVGKDTEAQDGAALFTVTSEPARTLVIDCGQGAAEDPMSGLLPINELGIRPLDDTATLQDGVGLLKSPAHPFSVAVKSVSGMSVEKSLQGGEYLRVRADGRVEVLIAYAKAPEAARQLADINPQTARQQVDAYYEKLLQCEVQTPVPAINQAFRWAAINLEYAWNSPFGWTESINYWHALWHMQHTAGVEWLGLADRSRLSNLTHAENLMTDGAVPQMMQYLHTRRDFGGSDQFFAWQVRHYWQFTADKEFAAKLAPVMDRVIEHAFAENDVDHDGLLGWGLQIGNQEDYIATPHNGTTPSIEGINMWRTRRELAVGLGDSATAARCEVKIREIEGRLRDQLWQGDLGRFIFYRDPLGPGRLDGQYHTLAYPVIWGITDLLDSWTSIRHMRDRLTGPRGEVYCSNNFPTHIVATVGTQAGAAQQPWAAWALATAGLRNETWRPLNAVSEWVMDSNHRGVWPEVSTEPNPAYFSPPSGLFVAATVEALFGLKVNKPEGQLTVSPSFPDDWPAASVHLPDYQAEYKRQGNTLEYIVRSRDPLARHIRWSLPPANIIEVQVNGQRVDYQLEPGVQCVFLNVRTPPTTESRIQITLEPLRYSLQAPGSVAQGDPIDVRVDGVTVERVEDRSNLLNEIQLHDAQRVTARVRTGLLEPYQPYGMLGQLTFSRRTFFIACRGGDQIAFWLPVDLAVLPAYEIAPAASLHLESNNVVAKLLVRNNTAAAVVGTGYLSVARNQFPFAINLAARSQAEMTVTMPANIAALFSPGSNKATIILPGHSGGINVTLDGNALFRDCEALRQCQAARLRPIALPANELIADTDWPSLRSFRAYPHMPWAGSRPPLEALADRGELKVPAIEGLTFEFTPRRFLPVSYYAGRPTFAMRLNGDTFKKLYLLLIPLIDNHDMYAPVAQLSVETENGAVIQRTLYFPGDVDWWSAPALVGDFATARKPRIGVPAMLGLLKPEQSDWSEGKPPVFPQPEYWTRSATVVLDSTVMNVIELDLGRPERLKMLTLTSLGSQPAWGIVGIAGEVSEGTDVLIGTPWELPPQYAEPRAITFFDQTGDLKGWQIEGDAFSVASVPGLFGFPTLNSLAKAGEQTTGKATSPAFRVGPQDGELQIEMQGGRSTKSQGAQNLAIRLVDETSGRLLKELLPKASPSISSEVISVVEYRGLTVRVELIDNNTEPSYAWIGIRSLRLKAQ